MNSNNWVYLVFVPVFLLAAYKCWTDEKFVDEYIRRSLKGWFVGQLLGETAAKFLLRRILPILAVAMSLLLVELWLRG